MEKFVSGTKERKREIIFLEAMMNSDGAERERYSNVYFKIIRGIDYCTDSDSD